MGIFAQLSPLQLIQAAITFIMCGALALWLFGRAFGMVFPRWDCKRLQLIAKAGDNLPAAGALLRQARDGVRCITGLPLAAESCAWRS